MMFMQTDKDTDTDTRTHTSSCSAGVTCRLPRRLLYSTGSDDTGTGASAVAGFVWMDASACVRW
jgi:hypothetical protein